MTNRTLDSDCDNIIPPIFHIVTHFHRIELLPEMEFFIEHDDLKRMINTRSTIHVLHSSDPHSAAALVSLGPAL